MPTWSVHLHISLEKCALTWSEEWKRYTHCHHTWFLCMNITYTSSHWSLGLQKANKCLRHFQLNDNTSRVFSTEAHSQQWSADYRMSYSLILMQLSALGSLSLILITCTSTQVRIQSVCVVFKHCDKKTSAFLSDIKSIWSTSMKNGSDKLTPSHSTHAETWTMFTALTTTMSQTSVLSSHVRKSTIVVTPISSITNAEATVGN